MVSGVGQPAAYAIVVLGEEVRPKQKDPAFRKEVETQLAQLLKEVNAELADYEKLQMIVIAQEPWSIENGFLTPTLKIRRNRIESDVTAKVEGWYAGKGKVQWA
jgi:long-subunit acyl-CoA synthetase (AMP-forming)